MAPLRWSVFLLLAACGGSAHPDSDAAPMGIDASTGRPDADPRVPDAAPVHAGCPATHGTTVAFERVAAFTGEHDGVPVLVTSPPHDRRLFVVLRPGTIRVIKDGAVLPEPFIDLSQRGSGAVLGGLTGDDERGLLGLAFDPDYATNGKLYVYYTGAPTEAGAEATDLIVELQVDAANPDKATPTGRTILALADPRENHNGGMLAFGTDGMLWVGIGDGGGQGDFNGNAQNDGSLFGKMLRIDVTLDKPVPMIWAKGLRNPWRWSFDPATDDLYIGDVGQDMWEEVDVVSTRATGLNFGWNAMEGLVRYPAGVATPPGLTAPVSVHSHDDGWHALIGGAVYRGECYPDLVGDYFYADYAANEVWSFRWNGSAAVNDHKVATATAPTSLHADSTGELFMTLASGEILHLVAGP